VPATGSHAKSRSRQDVAPFALPVGPHGCRRSSRRSPRRSSAHVGRNRVRRLAPPAHITLTHNEDGSQPVPIGLVVAPAGTRTFWKLRENRLASNGPTSYHAPSC
jgi:hypothetical protein